MAVIPKRATACEKVLSGKDWNEETVRVGMEALDKEFTPISDMRASSDYRQLVVRNLLYRFYAESNGSGAETNVYNFAR